MNKHIASIVAGSLLLLAGAGTARADERSATVIAERRALKPNAALSVVDTTIDVRVWRTEGGWQPTNLDFDLWGKSDSANAIAVKWKDGAKVFLTTECEAPDIDESKELGPGGQWKDQAQVKCQVKGGAVAVNHTGNFEAEIYLRVAGKPEQLLRKVSFAVGAVKETDSPTSLTRWYVDHDYKLAETVGYWDWDASSLHLRTYTKQAADIQADGKLRCTVDGKPFAKDGVVQPGGGMSLGVTGAGNKEWHWVQLEGAIWLPRSSDKWTPGKYECQMIVAAKVLRTIRFTLDAKLAFVTSSEQQGPGAIASRTTFLPDFDIPAGADLPFSRAGFTNLALSGRPWKGSPPAAIASASNLAIAAAPSTAAPATEKSAGGKSTGGKKTKPKGKTAKRK